MFTTKRMLFTLSVLLLAFLSVPALASSTEPSASSFEKSFEKTVDEALTELRIRTALLENIGWDLVTAGIEVDGNHAILEGTVTDQANRRHAEEVALSIEGIETVKNNLKVEKEETDTPVADAIASAESSLKNAVLESRVKAELISEMGTNAFGIDVEAVDGRVSLRGEVPEKELETVAIKAAESCEGVDSVIDLLSLETSS